MPIIDQIDQIDRKLLRLVQDDATITNSGLAERLAVSASGATRRRKSLEECGYITGYSARLNPDRLGLGIHAFVEVFMSWQSTGAAEDFQTTVRNQPGIAGAWALTGKADYLLSVYCRDLPALNRLIHEVLLKQKSVSRVESKIVMERVHESKGLPVA